MLDPFVHTNERTRTVSLIPMFAGLAVDGISNTDDDDDDEAALRQGSAPPPKAPKQRLGGASLLPRRRTGRRRTAAPAAMVSQGHPCRLRWIALLGGIDPVDLEITIETLRAVGAISLFRSRPFKGLREALGPLAAELIGKGGGGSGGGTNRGRRERQQQHKSRLGDLDPVERMKQMDRDAMNHRVLRAERLARLEEIQQIQGPEDESEALAQRLLTHGGDDPSASLNAAQGASLVPFHKKGGSSISASAIPDGPAMAGSGSGGPLLLDGAAAAPAKLNLARSCYICKAPYRELHAFYAQLCMPCAELNWHKRFESCNLHGRVALVTGGRVKISSGLSSLRAGGGDREYALPSTPSAASPPRTTTPSGSTAFMSLADLRDLQGLEQLCDALPKLVRRLDIIISNACQTIQRPPSTTSRFSRPRRSTTTRRRRTCSDGRGHRSGRALVDAGQSAGHRPSSH